MGDWMDAELAPFVCLECGRTYSQPRTIRAAVLCNHGRANFQGVPMVSVPIPDGLPEAMGWLREAYGR